MADKVKKSTTKHRRGFEKVEKLEPNISKKSPKSANIVSMLPESDDIVRTQIDNELVEIQGSHYDDEKGLEKNKTKKVDPKTTKNKKNRSKNDPKQKSRLTDRRW